MTLPRLGAATHDLSGGRVSDRSVHPAANWPPGSGRGGPALPPTLAYVVVDVLAVAVAAVVAHLLRFGLVAAYLPGPDIPYALIALGSIPTWLAVVALAGGYDRRALGVGAEEYRRILDGGVHFLAVVAVLHFIFRLVFARGWVGVMIPVAVVLTLFARYLLRQWLFRQRANGRYVNRILLVGARSTVVDVGERLARARWSGLAVVAVCIDPEPGRSAGPPAGEPENGGTLEIAGTPVPMVSRAGGIAHAIEATGADLVAVTDETAADDLAQLVHGAPAGVQGGHGDAGASLGADRSPQVDLLVAPAISDVAGPRTVLREVGGLPFLHVEEPTFSGPQRVVKELFDRFGALAGLMVLAPLGAVMALLIRLDSGGPVFYRQVRVGRNGDEFEMVKFRTMVANADQLRSDLVEQDDGNGVLFKLHRDPRITRVGRVLRRWSLDELPQLWNVLRGQMSLVGPRPPLPEEVARYEWDVNRRLLVKPGMTGLWQVSGRSDLPWAEAVRLDLYYVDHWSPVMDAAIILRTFSAVVRGQGAY